jgi:hypothetical protein
MPGFSMMGSGIYSTTITREIVCAEMCGSCEEDKTTCTSVSEVDFETDDWGNVEQDVTCKICNHTYTFREESD